LWSERLKENPHLEDLGLDERIKYEWTWKHYGGGGANVDWIHLAHDRDKGRALLNTAMDIRVSKGGGVS
jgi:hypothetical protein